MAGTSARSKASSPRPAMTERGCPRPLAKTRFALFPVMTAMMAGEKREGASSDNDEAVMQRTFHSSSPDEATKLCFAPMFR